MFEELTSLVAFEDFRHLQFETYYSSPQNAFLIPDPHRPHNRVRHVSLSFCPHFHYKSKKLIHLTFLSADDPQPTGCTTTLSTLNHFNLSPVTTIFLATHTATSTIDCHGCSAVTEVGIGGHGPVCAVFHLWLKRLNADILNRSAQVLQRR